MLPPAQPLTTHTPLPLILHRIASPQPHLRLLLPLRFFSLPLCLRLSLSLPPLLSAMAYQASTGFIPANGPVLLNTHGSPNQGLYIPAGPLAAQASGFITTQEGVKGHHTVVHPVIIQQAPPPPPPPVQTIIKEVPVPMPVPAPRPRTCSAPRPSTSTSPTRSRRRARWVRWGRGGGWEGGWWGVVLRRRFRRGRWRCSRQRRRRRRRLGCRGWSVYDQANGATVMSAGERGPIPRQTNVTTTTTTGM